MASTRFDENKPHHEACIEASKEARKDGRAGKKQAVTRAMQQAFFDCPSRTIYHNKHLKESAINYIIDGMFGKDGQWVREFIDTQLKEAKTNPNSKAAERLATGLFHPQVWEDIDNYLNKQQEEDIDFKKYQIRTTLYDKQQQVFDDEHSKKHIVICSRRAGKSELMGRLAAKHLLRAGSHVVYINRSSTAAVRQIKHPLEQAIKKSGLTVVRGSVEGQELYFNNGSQLYIIGNNNLSDVNKLRGEAISCCLLDECGHQRNIRQLLREVIEPALTDYGKDARLYMVGTPPRAANTYIEEVYNNAIERGYKKWHWTFLDNPFIPDREAVIDEVCRDNGVTKDSAFVRREYYGELGVYDSDALWIKKYSKATDIPKSPLFAYIGVDWGYEDRAAVVSVVASKQLQKAWIVDSWSESKKGIIEVSKEIQRQYNNLQSYNLERQPWVICDNNEKGAVYDLSKSYGIPNVFTAYKYDLNYAQDQLNELFSTNKFVIAADPSGRVEEDLQQSMWKRDEETDIIIHELDDDLHHPNALMALLYVSRQFAVDVLGWVDNNKAARDIIQHYIGE